MLHHTADHHYPLPIAEGVHIHLHGIVQVLVDQHRVVGLHLDRLHHVAVELRLVVNHLHGPAAQHVAGAHHHWIAHARGDGAGLGLTAGQAIAGLANLQAPQDRLKLLPVFGGVDRLRRRTPDAAARGQSLRGGQPVQQRNRQLEGRLAAELDDHPHGPLHLDHVEHVFEAERFEVEPVAGVVVGGNGFRVAVHHHRGEALGLQGEGGVAAAVVKFDALADAIGATAQDHHLGACFRLDLIFRGHGLQLASGVDALQRALIGGVVIWGAGGELRRTGVDGLEHGVNPQGLAVAPHRQLIAARGPGQLAVGEAQLLQLQQGRRLQLGEAAALQQPLFGLENVAQLGQEPGINGTELVDLPIAAAGDHRLAHGKDPIGGGGAQGPGQGRGFPAGIGPVTAPAGMARFQGAQGLLERLLKTAANCHRLPHRLHRGGEHRRAAPELLEGETGNLRDHVVDRGFEAGRRGAGDVIDDLVEGVAHRQAGGDLGDRKTRGLGGQRRAARNPRIHFDHHHIAVGGVDGELDIAAARIHADFADDRDRLVAQALVFPVSEGLGGRHGDRVAGVNPHRIEVFDAADDHHVVGAVAHHLQLKFLPAQQRLLDQDLGDGAGLQAALADRPKLLRVVGDAATAAAQGEGGANDAGITADGCAHLLGLLRGVGNAGRAHRHADALHRLLEQQPIFRLLDRRQVGADQLNPVFGQGAVLGQGHRQVEGGLAAHGGQQGIGALDLDHPGHHLGGERLDVGAIGHVRIGHDRSGVGVHQHHLKAFGPQGFTGLGAGIVEFTGLADHDRTRPQQQDATQVRAAGHGGSLAKRAQPLTLTPGQLQPQPGRQGCQWGLEWLT